MKGRPHSTETIQKIQHLLESRKSVKEIVSLLGIPLRSVYMLIRNNRLSPLLPQKVYNTTDAMFILRIKKMRYEGRSISYITKTLEISKYMYLQLDEKYKFYKPRRGTLYKKTYKRAIKRRVVLLLKEGLPPKAIAQRMQRSPALIYAVIHDIKKN